MRVLVEHVALVPRVGPLAAPLAVDRRRPPRFAAEEPEHGREVEDPRPAVGGQRGPQRLVAVDRAEQRLPGPVGRAARRAPAEADAHRRRRERRVGPRVGEEGRLPEPAARGGLDVRQLEDVVGLATVREQHVPGGVLAVVQQVVPPRLARAEERRQDQDPVERAGGPQRALQQAQLEVDEGQVVAGVSPRSSAGATWVRASGRRTSYTRKSPAR